MPTVPININIILKPSPVGGVKDITVDPTQVHARRGEVELIWKLTPPGEEFELSFHVQLFEELVLVSKNSEIRRTIPANVPVGTYAYAIQGRSLKKGMEFRIPNCPEIIIQ